MSFIDAVKERRCCCCCWRRRNELDDRHGARAVEVSQGVELESSMLDISLSASMSTQRRRLLDSSGTASQPVRQGFGSATASQSQKSSNGVEMNQAREEYTINISRADFTHELREKILGQPLALNLLVMDSHLVITAIEEGPIEDWNKSHRCDMRLTTGKTGLQPDLQVRVGDHIHKVNGMEHAGQKLFKDMLKPSRTIELTLSREAISNAAEQQGPSQSWVHRTSEASWILGAVQGAINPIARGVAERIGQLYSTKGAKARSITEKEEQERVQKMVRACKGLPLEALSAEETGENRWCITGVFAYQALKVGLRRLSVMWRDEDLTKFPKGKFVMKKKLLQDLLTGSFELSAVPKADIAAAQRDVMCLSAAQLVQLKVRCMDADLTGDAHKSFLTTLDMSLFGELGRKVCAGISLDDEDVNVAIIGLEALQLAAASTALPSPSSWAYWIADRQRVVFNSDTFALSALVEFPKAGIFEVSDYSQKDSVSGIARMDWQIRLITDEAKLQTLEDHLRTSSKVKLGDLVSEDILASSLGQLKKTRGKRLTGLGSQSTGLLSPLPVDGTGSLTLERNMERSIYGQSDLGSLSPVKENTPKSLSSDPQGTSF